mgnify:CR=1 FL=1
MRKIIVPIFLVVLTSIAFGAGFYFSQSQIPVAPPEGLVNVEIGQPQGMDFSLFWEAWAVLEDKFVDHAKIDYQKMIYGAIEGMVSSLKDPYTVFMPPDDAKILKKMFPAPSRAWAWKSASETIP